ncbi:MAG: hypothetical protein KJ795_02600 [Gammaproteobacteria bacterium]|nr:hypothetical protein [Gammaproteobacteria bacterium]MBU1777370.1 hypothetical protein [Gammaproteobacteria bacterium]MBU1967658.1 hypothetical protein [Gammaproteobacteria bacterium]
MESYWLWWTFAVLLIVTEMFSGTFYLLAVALGLAAAGLAAFMGTAWTVQVLIAAVLCTTSVAWIHRWKKRQAVPQERSNLANDIGQSVRIVSWTDERRARVSYRGAEWDASLSSEALADSERQTWQIKDIVGTQLIIR